MSQSVQVLTTEKFKEIVTLVKQGHNLYKGNSTKKAALEIAGLNRTAFDKVINDPKYKNLLNIIEAAKKIGDKIPVEIVLDFDADSFSMEEVEESNTNEASTGFVIEENYNSEL